MTDEEVNRVADLVVEKIANRLAPVFPYIHTYQNPMVPQYLKTVACNCPPNTACNNVACPYGNRLLCQTSTSIGAIGQN